MKKQVVLFIGLVVFVLIFSKCTKVEDNSGVPNVAVNLVVNVNLPSNFNIQSIGGYDYYQGGSRGIIIYRADLDQFNAYDRHSTYKPENGCAVEVDSTAIFIVDPCSDSRYSLISGEVIQGPAVAPLKQYRTDYNNGVLRVWN
jgi:Rieske Fe-S protein